MPRSLRHPVTSHRLPRPHLSRGRRRAVLVTVAAAAAVAVAAYAPATFASAASLHSSHGQRPGVAAKWKRVFFDNFSGPASQGVDSQWIYDTGPGSNFGTGEIETMTNSISNVHLTGHGGLDITALGSGQSWTSGRIQTASANVGAPAGGLLKVTSVLEQPNPGSGVGYWPAFWMLGPGQWPENGEIDILEDVNALSEHSGTFHCGTFPGGPCNEGNGIGSGLQGCSGCQSGFHRYTVIIDRRNTSAESITWFLDGKEFFRVNESQVPTSTWQAAVDHNFTIIYDLAMGGDYPNGVCGCTSPTGATTSGGTMTVKTVAAFTKG